MGHVPGAAVLRGGRLLAPARRDVRARAPPGGAARRGAPCAALRTRLGIAPDTTVVIHGDGPLWATFAYWALRHGGHRNVCLLDGGHPAWTRAGMPLTTARPARPAQPS